MGIGQKGRIASRNKRPVSPTTATANPRLRAKRPKTRSICEKQREPRRGQPTAARTDNSTTTNSTVNGATLKPGVAVIAFVQLPGGANWADLAAGRHLRIIQWYHFPAAFREFRNAHQSPLVRDKAERRGQNSEAIFYAALEVDRGCFLKVLRRAFQAKAASQAFRVKRRGTPCDIPIALHPGTDSERPSACGWR